MFEHPAPRFAAAGCRAKAILARQCGARAPVDRCRAEGSRADCPDERCCRGAGIGKRRFALSLIVEIPRSINRPSRAAKAFGLARTFAVGDQRFVQQQVGTVLAEGDFRVAECRSQLADHLVCGVDFQYRLCCGDAAARAGEQLLELTVRPFSGPPGRPRFR